jgi:hypothetical protein
MKIVWFPIAQRYIRFVKELPADKIDRQLLDGVPIDITFVLLACIFYPFKIVRDK